MASPASIRIAANNTGVGVGATPGELEAMYVVTQTSWRSSVPPVPTVSPDRETHRQRPDHLATPATETLSPRSAAQDIPQGSLPTSPEAPA
jgi:hypothetical protein